MNCFRESGFLPKLDGTQCPSGPAVRLFLSLLVLVVVLLMILEGPGPGPAQGAPEAVDPSSGLDKLKEFGNTPEDKVREFFNRVKESDIPAKTRNWFSETLQEVKEKFRIESRAPEG
ncbi:apolipoprotein C-I-like [Aotus nancymaae]|uniref:apolipoprotein C-I-like n=1 Tax=Aotus nancymaae TaxID=37293 RepID=UPI000B50822F|nr:apolipoprotein C-I-like [Aotus nancymaae]